MKKIFYLTVIIFALVYACEPYEEFKGDNEFTTVYFPFQQPVRQLVVGEGLSFYIGVVMGGKRSNDNNEWARIEIDESLVEGTPMKVLPSSYYTLSTTSEVAIPAGDFRGLIKVTLDSSLFVNDDSCYFQHYAIPMRITETSLDSILPHMNYTIFGVRAFNSYHAVYYHLGRSLTDSAGIIVDETIYTRPVSSNNAIWKVYSSSEKSVTTDGIGRYLSNDLQFYKMRLDLDQSDVSISTDENSLINITDLGSNKYNDADRNFTLNYSFIDSIFVDADTLFDADTNIVEITPPFSYTVTKIVNDTLVFRNVPLSFEEWVLPEVEE